MIACPFCARENPAEFAFCPACGTKLTDERPSVNESKTLTEERKVVSTLFCDLVSYTAHSEASDHELIDALLRRYNALAQASSRATAAWSRSSSATPCSPSSASRGPHDDDAERAVRCASSWPPRRIASPGPTATPSRCASASTPARPTCTPTSTRLRRDLPHRRRRQHRRPPRDRRAARRRRGWRTHARAHQAHASSMRSLSLSR